MFREEVSETKFKEVPDKGIFEGNSVRQNDVHSEDPFGIYEVLNKKMDGKNIDDKHKDSLKYPSGFTPNKEGDVPVEKVDNWSDENKVNDGQEDRVCVGQHVHERVEVSNDTHESTCSGHFKKSEVPRKGRFILELIDDLVNLGQTMEYDMTGCIKNMEEIIESQGVVSKSSAVSAADAPNQHQQLTTPLNIHLTPAPTCQTPSSAPIVISSENINQAEPNAESDQVADDEFINIFSTPIQDRGETSSHHVDSSNMHTFYQRYPSEHRWTKDHPLEQVIGNPSQSVRTRRQLESDAEMCMFALIVSRTEPKNIKEAMADSA
nr:integrase, catalytic region, zinc finger, CCHC-type, peptidase aspartic, catalytic [Tanacetum cinerariifolium]